jgi:hypothetical protein
MLHAVVTQVVEMKNAYNILVGLMGPLWRTGRII